MTYSADSSQPTVIYPLLPLRDVVVFPHMVIPLFVGRPKSIKALETAMEAGKSILLVAQKSAAKDEPSPEDLYDIGSIANILQMLKLPDGTVKVLVEGVQRARVLSVVDEKTHYAAEALPDRQGRCSEKCRPVSLRGAPRRACLPERRARRSRARSSGP